jgi:hypothetical protein
MKALFTLFAILYSNLLFSQQLQNVLEGYSISKIPTNRSIVGSKWVSGLGATTVGIPEDQLTISQSLNNLSLDNVNEGSLKLALLSNLGLSGFSTDELSVVFNKLEVYTINDLYNIPLVKGEKIVYSSIKAESFDLIFNKELSANINAKLPKEYLNWSSEIDYNNKKRLSIDGSDLFVAHKIVELNKVVTQKKKKKFYRGNTAVNDVLGYDFVFNINDLVTKSIQRAIDVNGKDELMEKSNLNEYIIRYSKIAPIKVNISNNSKGSLGRGLFKKVIELCYCELNNGNVTYHPITITNTGDKIVYDYFLLDSNFTVAFTSFGWGSQSNFPSGISYIGGDTKLNVISQTYFITKVLD